MASLNRVLLIGNLTRDPELRYIPSGSAVATFSLAINNVYKTAAGEKKEDVCFIKVVVWGKTAENCAEYLKKGRSCFVEGRLQTRSWDGPDGQKKYSTEVIAATVQFLDGRPGAGRSSGDEFGGNQGAAGAGSHGPLEEISLDMPSEPPSMGGDVTPF
jgi:single-strand DNA-binding protein